MPRRKEQRGPDMPALADSIAPYLERFSETLAGAAREPAWLLERRKRAMERFARLGVPTLKHEEYKYTDLSALADGQLLFAPPPGLARAGLPAYAQGDPVPLPAGGGPAVRGAVPPGARVLTLAEALDSEPELLERHLGAIADCRDHAICALNTAFFSEAVVIAAGRGAVFEEPLHLVFRDPARNPLPRVLIVAERNASVRVVETYSGSGAYWRNAVTEIHAAENARVEHYRAQVESAHAFHTGLLQASQQRDSHVSTFSISFGAAVARNDIGTRLNGPGCECSLDGIYAARGAQLVDHHTSIDHAMPHCNSHQLYKGVLDDSSRGVFNGKIFVRPDAQKTDAVQSNKNLLLSDQCEVNTKPQLEIDANDVRCTHGATVGQLDAETAFYLQSRGIAAERARSLLTYAFAADALERIKVAPLKERFESLLLDRFAAPGS